MYCKEKVCVWKGEFEILLEIVKNQFYVVYIVFMKGFKFKFIYFFCIIELFEDYIDLVQEVIDDLLFLIFFGQIEFFFDEVC